MCAHYCVQRILHVPFPACFDVVESEENSITSKYNSDRTKKVKTTNSGWEKMDITPSFLKEKRVKSVHSSVGWA